MSAHGAAVVRAPILVGGEALYDLVAREDSLSGHPGGGPFNTARTIGRLGQPVTYLGRLSTDRLGETHMRMLAADRVDLSCVVRTDQPTTLALAALDDGATATYSFYSVATAAPGLTVQDALAVIPATIAALHVGTLGLVLEPLATALEAVVERFAGQTLVMIDPNCRPAAIADAAAYRARLGRLLRQADVIKVSEDDLAWLDPGRPYLDAARALLEHGPSVALLTRGADGTTVLTARGDAAIPAVGAEVVDTIGAGDALSGGFLAWWASHGLRRSDLATEEHVIDAARFASIVAARTVARAGASPPELAAGVAPAAPLGPASVG